MVNDQVYVVTDDERKFDRAMQLEFLRDNFAIAPFQGTLHSCHRRICRLFSTYQRAWANADADIKAIVDECLMKDLGVTTDDLFSLLFPLNTYWVTTKDFTQNVHLNIKSLDQPELRSKMENILNRMSLNPDEYSTAVLKFKEKQGPSYLRSSALMAMMVQKPAIRIAPSEYILIAPQLILRKLEIAVTSAYIEKRDKAAVKYERLKGPLGNAFEAYAMDVVASAFTDTKSSGLVSIFEPSPKKNDGEELTDGIIHDPDACIIFEAKNRPPPLHAIDLSNPDTCAFESWLGETFYYKDPKVGGKREKRDGALWQLHGAAEYLLTHGAPSKPWIVVPVVVLSEDSITDLPLYMLLDQEIERQSIFAGLYRVTKFVFISIDELQYLCSMKLPERYPCLQHVFHNKATAESAREMNWGRFLKAIGCEFVRSTHDDEVGRKLMERTAALFPKEERGV